MELRQTLPPSGGTTNCAFSLFQGVVSDDRSDSCGKGRGKLAVCLVFPKGRIEGVKAKRSVCPTLAARFSFFQSAATGIKAPQMRLVRGSYLNSVSCVGIISRAWVMPSGSGFRVLKKLETRD